MPPAIFPDNQTAPLLPPSSLDSEVSWHVLLWVLMSLAVNSMAQPSHKMFGFFTRHRIYLCSSPILCIVDSIFVMVFIIFIKFYLAITFREASQIVTLLGWSGSPQKQPIIEELKIEGPSWPRFIFFILGPLPAIIKLASFSGTPWTKAWGMMFAVSFSIMETVNYLAQGSTKESKPCVRSILEYSEEEWQEDAQRIRRVRSGRLRTTFSRIVWIFLLAAFIAHCTLATYATNPLWRAIQDLKCMPDHLIIIKWAQRNLSLPYLLLYFMVLILSIICILSSKWGRIQLGWVFSASRWSSVAFALSLLGRIPNARTRTGLRWPKT